MPVRRRRLRPTPCQALSLLEARRSPEQTDPAWNQPSSSHPHGTPVPTGRAGRPRGCQECAQSLGTDRASCALSTFEGNTTPPAEQPWPQRPSRGGVILGAEEAEGTEGEVVSRPAQASPWGSRASWPGGALEPSVYPCRVHTLPRAAP